MFKLDLQAGIPEPKRTMEQKVHQLWEQKAITERGLKD